jgi:hypothetical protein
VEAVKKQTEATVEATRRRKEEGRKQTRRRLQVINCDNGFFFFYIILDWGPVPRFVPWKYCSQCGLLYNPHYFSKCSHSGRQVPPRPQRAVVPYQPKKELWARNGGQIVPGICTQDSFTCCKSATWDR